MIVNEISFVRCFLLICKSKWWRFFTICNIKTEEKWEDIIQQELEGKDDYITHS